MSLVLRSISLFQFKNYFQQEFQFTERVVGICGRNGKGKTNLLDAIYYLCFTKSYFTRQDAVNVLKGHEGFRIQGDFLLNDQPERTVCILRENGKKEFLVNDEAYTRFSKHIGRYPCVVIAPDDVQLLIGGSEERRKFIDTLLSQMDADYLKSLIQYSRILQQRNSFLRTYQENYEKDLTVLDILDEQLAKEGQLIFEKRRQFSLRFLPIVKQLYNDICQHYEDISLYYESEHHQLSLDELLKHNRQKDLMLQRTSGGIHRDDLLFHLGDQPFRAIASQGQRKSLLFALKLAEFEILKEEKKRSPILMLDDVFEKLDDERITNLLQRVCQDPETQIFITDTSCKRLQEQFEKMGQAIQLVAL
ncbi:MAG: DNA replication/repair protein RecF [Flavisolibacter sp.]